MITIGKFTKELYQDQYVMVELLHGEIAPCKPVFAFPLIAVPTQNWLDTYGDKFMAVVAFQDDLEEKPLLIGLLPLKGKVLPQEGHVDNYFIYSKKFRLWLDDANNKCVVDVLDNGKVMLGNKDVTEPGVLGDKNADVLDDIKTRLSDIHTILNNLNTQVLASLGGTAPAVAALASNPFDAGISAALTPALQTVFAANQSLTPLLSQLQVNINALQQPIQDTKSETVFLK